MNSEQLPNDQPVQPAQPASSHPNPVAYDANGQPLYAHPPASSGQTAQQTAPQPAVVHVARAVDPVRQPVSPEIKKLHDSSARIYPNLHLSEGEYVVRSVRRHPIGLIVPLSVGVLLIAAALTLLSGYEEFATSLSITGYMADPANAVAPILSFVVVVALGMFISWYVYTRNRFFLTNESVIQEIQHTLFSRHEQTVSLGSIEDASFTQKGIFQNIFNYGDIRLSTEGDETTYHFTYVMNPRDHIARLNDAVESFKNGRPVSPSIGDDD